MNLQEIADTLKGFTSDEIKKLALILEQDAETELGLTLGNKPIIAQPAATCPTGYYHDPETNKCVLSVGTSPA